MFDYHKRVNIRMAKARTGSGVGGGATRFLNIDPDKLRGGYYTPADLARWIAEWSIQSPDDQVLEPSCGDGAFLEAAALRLLDLGTKPEAVAKQLQGIEISALEAAKSADALFRAIGVDATGSVSISDFFEWWQLPGRGTFDAILGNPPFIRYQSFPEPPRSRAMGMMLNEGLRPNKLTNSWVPFVVASVRALNPGGRMGLVLPAEILQVSYAAQLREFLVQNFADIHVIACNELIFEKAEQEVVVLLADGALANSDPENDCKVAIASMPSRRSLIETSAETVIAETPPKEVQHADEKWLKYFLSQQQIDLLRALRAGGVATSLSDFATVDVGVVTGKNDFFVLNDSQVRKWKLDKFVYPLAGRAAHLSGAIFSEDHWQDLADRGERVYLLQLGDNERHRLPKPALEYVVSGEALEYDTGYKCSIRDPWYSVPSVWAPDAFLFRQIYDFPRVLLNDAGATCTDTIHRMNVHSGSSQEVAAMCFTSLTAASAEIEGRSYGGGVLELEPTEAERLLVPASIPSSLNMSEIDRMIRDGRMSEVLDINDKKVLGDHLGLSANERRLLRSAWETMRERRLSRRRAPAK
jgi:adenine-specific DNA-methyltransferase